MNVQYLPSPPLSPFTDFGSNISFESTFTDTEETIRCGGCNRELGTDWFCSDCHRRCGSCNRFLAQEDEYCTRCWLYDPVRRQYHRKQQSVFIQYYHQSSGTTVAQGYNSSAENHNQYSRQHLHQQEPINIYHGMSHENRAVSDFTGLPSPSNSTGSEVNKSSNSSTTTTITKFSLFFNRK